MEPVGIGLACFGLLGAAIGLGLIFAALINGTARNPSAYGDMLKAAFIGGAMVEALGLFALLLALLILFK
ncbi:ATP synthase subunit c [Candidatus Fokinia solitaria]|uniref:ATP synthase subunit c n=1 Tax=Candidatus Fokinia solitaria TaxID=1802984 RepID=A0A2U8BR94_9RICK|nr:F0F1 ATP synthase subunit C [Candidatus Fokinia solitaria]AWD32849.1 ATP synthase subunit c [Candidatus Fokinia solitaria]